MILFFALWFVAMAIAGATAFVNALMAPYVVSGRTREIGAQSALRSDYRTNGHALTLEWEPGIGDLTLKSITARRTAITRSATSVTTCSRSGCVRYTAMKRAALSAPSWRSTIARASSDWSASATATRTERMPSSCMWLPTTPA